MKIKRFVAASLQDAKEQIVRELGEDAIVLSSRQVKRPGLWGWLGFSQVEVTAAVDTPLSTPEAKEEPQPLAYPTASPPWESLQQDLLETKRMLKIMAKRLQSSQSQPAYPDALATFYERLRTTGLADDLLAGLCDDLLVHLTPEELRQEAIVEQWGSKLLASRLVPYAERTASKPHIVCLVGPTG
ncbi:MAG: hypothetical protein GX033_04555, partial [Firmicutes bacterium]|nr:hypothetical protein [Bacillota bacterium]